MSYQSHLPRYYGDVPRIIARACNAKVNYTHEEHCWVMALKALLPREPHTGSWGASHTTVEKCNPWRHLYVGTIVTKATWKHDWDHAGRRYTLNVTKTSPDPVDWTWSVSTDRRRRFSARVPFTTGQGLASLSAWVLTRWPGAVALPLPPSDAPEPIRWPGAAKRAA